MSCKELFLLLSYILLSHWSLFFGVYEDYLHFFSDEKWTIKFDSFIGLLEKLKNLVLQ